MPNPSLFRSGLLGAALFFPVLSLPALLDFETTTVQLDAEPGAKRLVATFPFTNTGDEPVEITDTRASCGCTTPELEKTVYAPGEGGEIKAIFDVGSRVGFQKKTVTVVTDQSEQNTIVLTFEADIPEVMKVAPRLLLWRRNHEPDAKQIEVAFEHAPMHVKEVKLLNGQGFEVEVEAVEEGQTYLLHVKPESLENPTRAIFQIVTDYPADDPMTYTVFAYVR